ncbi:MAG: phosphatase PAP2 family protein [Candidatus Omnitrophica bacterium]|nr:phosphatase PAP2 family protein [Candidatus Omnitrophota bacterium]MDD5552859.1 phosphatase PAP2 family protein [Candidatus Omnitrophota bacterium]
MVEKRVFPKKTVFYTFLALSALFIVSVLFDRHLIREINAVWYNSFLDRFFSVFEFPGNLLFIGGVFSIFLSGVFCKRLKILTVIALAAIASYILVSYSAGLIKRNTYKPRPFEEVYNLDLRKVTSVDSRGESFPSGHAAAAFALIFPFIIYSRKFYIKALLFVMGGLMAYSRVYLGAHFLSDVAAGAALGTACAVLCYLLFINKKEEARIPLPQIYLWIFLFLFAAAIMHRPFSLVHPVTAESLDPGFTLQYPAIRLIFEPYLGLAAYFNLSGNITAQQLSWSLWACAAILLIIFRSASLKKKRLRNKTAIFITAVACVIFTQLSMFSGRLPVYKIVSRSKNDLIIDLHTHTNTSYPWQWKPASMIYQHLRSGFQGSFVTDYDTTKGAQSSMEAVKEKHINFLLMPGQEYRGEKIHLLLLGHGEDIPAAEYGPEEAVYRTHALGGVVIVPHYWSGTHKHYSLADLAGMGVDGFEIANRSEIRLPGQKKIAGDIYAFSRANGLLMVGGTDNHGLRSATYVWNAFHLDAGSALNPEAAQGGIMDVLRGRKQDKISVITLHSKEYSGWPRLAFDPVFSLFYYFRGLGLLQWLSWAAWAFIFSRLARWIKIKYS